MNLNNNNINNNNINIQPNYWLVCSTSTLIFPIVYAYKKNNKILTISSTIALFGSLNYWRKPCIGYRKNIDLITSKLSVLAYFYYGYNHIIGLYSRLFGYTNLYFLYYFYNKSCNNFYLQNKNWKYYHVAFHLFGTIGQLYVIYLI